MALRVELGSPGETVKLVGHFLTKPHKARKTWFCWVRRGWGIWCGDERIALMRRFLDCFGPGCIKALLADRHSSAKTGFAGCRPIRSPYPAQGKHPDPNAWNHPIPAKVMFRPLAAVQFRHLEGRRPIWGCFVHLSALHLKDGELLIIASSDAPQSEAFTAYRNRLDIETLFGALKSRGRVKSYFRHGLDFIRRVLFNLNQLWQDFLWLLKFFVPY